jgi:hypothetical protein
LKIDIAVKKKKSFTSPNLSKPLKNGISESPLSKIIGKVKRAEVSQSFSLTEAIRKSAGWKDRHT